MFDISSDKVVLIPYKTGQYFWNACRRDDDVPAKGNRCPYCKSAQHSVHPMSPRRHGDAGGSLRVFRQFSWLKPIPSNRCSLVPPTSTPKGHTHRVLRKRQPLGAFINIPIPFQFDIVLIRSL